MKKYRLGETSADIYEGLTAEEKRAWLFPLNTSYHSFHLERMGADTFCFRDSRSAFYYIGSHFEVAQAVWTMLQCREADPHYQGRLRTTTTTLSQEEIDDLLSEL